MKTLLAVAALVFLAAGCALLGGPARTEGVDLVFEGNRELGSSELSHRVAVLFKDFGAARRPLSVLDDAAFELESAHREAGFPFVTVEYALEPVAGDDPVARFTIHEGPRTRIGELTVTGAREADLPLLRELLAGNPLDPAAEWYRAAEIEAGARRIEDWYRSRGHTEVRVGEPEITLAEDRRRADVRIAIEPGPAFLLRGVAIEVEGELPFPRAVLEEAVAPLLGRPFDERLARSARGLVEEALADRGFADAGVRETGRELAEGEARLAFVAVPGTRVRLGTVRFEGARRTSASFLRSRFPFDDDQWFNRSLVRQGLRDLHRSGIFERAELSIVPAPQPDPDGVPSRDLEVELVEAPAIEMFVEPGYGSYEQLRLSAGVRHRNLFGTGRTLDVEGKVAQLAQRIDASLIDPWILGESATLTTNVFGDRRQEPSFRRVEIGAGVSVTWRLTPQWRVRTGWQFRSSQLSDVEVAAPELDQDIDISEVTLAPTWDTRDSLSVPSTGHVTRGILDFSSDVLGSQLEFLRVGVEHSHFVPLAPRTVLAASARLGWIVPIGDTREIPLQERYFNGGENSVRSFRESQLGPKDADGSPVGGETYSVFTVEVRRELAGRLHGALFADAGNVLLEHQDIFTFDDLRYGVGAGLRYVLPIGPIRLDGAVNPSPRDEEARAAVHLSVGFSF